MRFQFVGKFRFNDESKPNPWIREVKTKDGKNNMQVMSIGVNDGNNTGFVEVIGLELRDGIKTVGTDKSTIEVKWKDRLDADTIQKVSGFRKFPIRIKDHSKEFITGWDFIEDFKKLKEEGVFDNNNYMVTGTVSKNFYNDTIRNRYSMAGLYTTIRNPGLYLEGEVFYTAEDIDISEWKDSHKIYLNGYTDEYIKDAGGKCYVPQQFVFVANPDETGDLLYLQALGIVIKDGKPEVTLNRKKVYHQYINCKLINGAENIEWGVNQLTPFQKLLYESGKKTLDELKPSNQIKGARVTYIKIIDIPCRNEPFTNGVTEADINRDDLDEKIFRGVVESTAVDLPFDDASDEDDNI